MAGEDKQLEIVLRLRDLMSRPLGTARASIKRFSRIAVGAFRRVTRAMRSMKRILFSLPALFAAVGLAAVTRLAKGLSNAASAATEMRNRFSVVFDGVTSEAQEMAEAIAKSAGRAVTDIQSMMSDFQGLFVPLGFARDDALKLSVALTEVGIDLTSFMDKASDQEATARLISGLVGNTRALRELRINLLDSTVKEKAFQIGLVDTNRELTEQEKTLARVALIMERSVLAFGDAIKTAQDFANTVKRLTSQIKGLREEIGEKLNVAILEAIQRIGGEKALLEIVSVTLNAVAIAAMQGIVLMADLALLFLKLVKAIGGSEKAINFFAIQIESLGVVFRVTFKMILVFMLLTNLAGIALVDGMKVLWSAMKVLGELIDTAFGPLIDELAQTLKDVAFIVIELAKLFGSILPLTMEQAVNAFAEVTLLAAKAAEQLEKIPIFGKKFEGVGLGLRVVAASMRFVAKDSKDLTGVMRKMLEETSPRFTELFQNWEELTNGIENRTGLVRILIKGLSTDFKKLGENAGTLKPMIDGVIAQLAAMEGGLEGAAASGEGLVEWMERMKMEGNELAAMLVNLSLQSGKVANSFDQFKEAAMETENVVENLAGGALFAFADGLAGAFGSIVSGAKSAKEAFKDFALSFISQIATMIARALILRAIGFSFFETGGVIPGGTGSATALATGGVVPGGLGSALPVKAYASGGPIFTGAHVAVIGEGKHNEAVVPLPDGRSIPVTMNGGGGSVTFNINMIDARGVDEMLTDRRDTIQDVIATGMGTRRTFRTTMQGNIP